jgi:hypothetical protein
MIPNVYANTSGFRFRLILPDLAGTGCYGVFALYSLTIPGRKPNV